MILFDKIEEAKLCVKKKVNNLPEIGVILGTGLAGLLNEVSVQKSISFEEVPHMPKLTLNEHKGDLIFGQLSGKNVLIQSGRAHYYEGFDMKEITFSIRLMKSLGIQTLIIASAVGGIHSDFEAGDISIVTDHINLMPEHPLRGQNDERLGPRYPDMSEPYDQDLIRKAQEIAKRQGVKLHSSVYAGLQGPSLETKAEYEYLHRIGATAVGMSTVPEVIVARHAGLKTCVFTAITNKCYPTSVIRKVAIEEVLSNAALAEKKMKPVVTALIEEI